MRKLLAVLLISVCAALALSQSYKPKRGETDVKVDVASKGTFFIKLFTDEAPKTTAQIIQLVQSGFYDSQRFHRVDKSPKPYLIQVGDPASKLGNLDDPKMGAGGSGLRLPYEDSGHQSVEGAVGMARTVDDQPTGDSQFYILLGTSKFLDGHYTVFGQIVSGMDVVKKVERGDRIVSATIVKG